MTATARKTPPRAFFCLTGPDGCGKSTHVRRLSAWLQNEQHQKTGVFSVWEIAKNPRYHSHAFISDRRAVNQYLGLLHGGSRALFVFHGLYESYSLAMSEEPAALLADGHWHKYAFTEHLHGEDLEWLKNIAGGFPQPRVTIFLDISPEIAWDRKQGAVTAYECGFASPTREHFLEFQTRLRDLFLREAQEAGWIVLATDRPEDDVADDIKKIVEKEV
jgi:thymidylate kinase